MSRPPRRDNMCRTASSSPAAPVALTQAGSHSDAVAITGGRRQYQTHPGPDELAPTEEFSESEGQDAPHALTRERLLSGAVDRMVRHAGITVLTDAEREKSLEDMLAARPNRGSPVWLFGYGSLIWNPTVHYVESRIAVVRGWQRAFCLSVPVGRGTPDNPGLVLALDRGGQCAGVAFRIAEDVLLEELSIVWRREMLTGAYIPHWVDLTDSEEQVFGSGIAFTINRAGPQYAALTDGMVIQRLATAKGQLGSAAEYLFHTQAGLQRLGIHDPLVDHLTQAVRKAQQTVA